MKKAPSKALLEFQNVSKIYQPDSQTVKALNQVSLKIKKGEFIAIMGPSGSGKSTLMHLAGCLDTPTKGKVFLEGRDVSQMDEVALANLRNKKIGFVFQSLNLIPRTTALENVSLPMIYAGLALKKRQRKALQLLKSVGLEKRTNHLPNQLSGGEQQRVAIARALANKPLLLFADEPTGNLDSQSGREIMKLLKQLHSQGHTIIMVTHETQIARWAKRIIKIKDGGIHA